MYGFARRPCLSVVVKAPGVGFSSPRSGSPDSRSPTPGAVHVQDGDRVEPPCTTDCQPACTPTAAGATVSVSGWYGWMAGSYTVADNKVEKVVYGVHAVRAREICATQFISARLAAAEKYARIMSTDPGVWVAAVTRYVMDAEGRRSSEALYVEGKRQEVAYVSDDRRICANGHDG